MSYIINFLSDNESSEESQESPGEGVEISGSQMSTTPQYTLPAADIKASLDKHPALDTIVEDAGNTTSMVLPPNTITSIAPSNTLQESLLPAPFPATFPTSEHQPPQMRSMPDPPMILEAPVNVDQSYTDATRNQEDLGQFPSCIKVMHPVLSSFLFQGISFQQVFIQRAASLSLENTPRQ